MTGVIAWFVRNRVTANLLFFGVAFATLITLFLAPVIYSLTSRA